ncbi:MAG: transposase [Oleispira sp.]|nr:transposase [Oleispira sp.]
MPRTEVIHDLSDSEKVCPHDGTALRHFSNETSEQLDYTPAQMSLLQHIRRKYTCPYCNNYMVTTNKPAQPIDNNAAENAIRPMVVGRKNWLFAATEKGVHEMSTATCVEDVEALLPAKRGLLRRYAIYKDRWQVELFFKAIKQNLKIKTFIGQSKNAILTQIWIAMITYLLLAFARHSAKTGWTVQRILRVIQVSLFERKGLTEILNPDSSRHKKSEPQMRFAL